MKDLSFRAEGTNGKGVLLIHGMTGAPGEMKLVARRFYKRGFTVSAPLLSGHGVDERALLRTTWRDWLGSVEDAYERLAPSVDEVYVAGVCAGGALGLALAAHRPKVKAAAVYSMTFAYDGWNMPRWAAAAPLLQLFANLPFVRRIDFEEPSPFGLKDERIRAMIERAPQSLIEGALSRMPLGALYQLYRLGRHIARIGPRVTTPTLILHARDDDMSHPRNAERLRSLLGGPVELTLMEDSYHMIHVDRERDRVGDMTADFFQRNSAAPVADARAGADA